MKDCLQYKTLFMIISILIVIPGLSNCDGIFESRKKESVKKVLRLEDFSHINIYGICNLVLRQDTFNLLTMEGVKDVVSDIEVKIMNDTLIIRNNNNRLFRIDERPSLCLIFKNISYLWTFDPVNVSSFDTLALDWFYYYPIGEIGEADLTINCGFFGLDNSANTLGRFYIKGKANDVHFFNRYGSSIYADSLISKEMQVINESIGDVYIQVENKLRVYIWGSGSIYYTGDPEVQVIEDRGTGNVVKLSK